MIMRRKGWLNDTILEIKPMPTTACDTDSEIFRDEIGVRCRANSAHLRQSGPDSGPDVVGENLQDLLSCSLFSCSSYVLLASLELSDTKVYEP